MRYYRFAVVIEKEQEDPGYYAYSPTLPGCFSSGLTIEETRENMREAIQLHVSSMLADGEPIPEDDAFVQVEEVTVAVPA